MSTELTFQPDSKNKFTWLAVLFAVILITSNLMASKLAVFGPLVLPSAVILYPFCFILSSVVAEVWGFGKARQVILMGFAANAFLVVFINISVYMPYVTDLFQGQSSYAMVYQAVPRILFASFIAYLVGEFCNAFVLTKMKKMFSSHHLYVRIIASTLIGQVFDTGLFIMVAFYTMMPTPALLQMMLAHYIVKVLIGSIIGTPLAYVTVHWARN